LNTHSTVDKTDKIASKIITGILKPPKYNNNEIVIIEKPMRAAKILGALSIFFEDNPRIR
jgi:hypothetical protein